jgi:hypothetical protein
MPFASGAKAESESHGPLGRIPLIPMLDDRGIEQRQRGDGVFHREVRANQELAIALEIDRHAGQSCDLFVASLKRRLQFFMPKAKILPYDAPTARYLRKSGSTN